MKALLLPVFIVLTFFNVAYGIEELLESLEQRVAELEQKVNNQGSGAYSEIPAFNVMTKDTTQMSSSPTVFRTVLLNDGNAYSDIDGTFTAPVDGLYSFSAYILTYSGASQLFIKREEDSLQCHNYGSGNGYFTGACTAVVRLNATEQVYVTADDGSGRVWGGHSGFSGFLISSA